MELFLNLRQTNISANTLYFELGAFMAKLFTKIKRVMHFCTVVLCMCVCMGAFYVSSVKIVYASTQTIVAVVNESAISASDLDKRMRLVVASSGLQNTKEIKKKLLQQVLNGLVSEQLMLQEAKKHGVTVDKKEIDSGLAQIAQQNNNKPEQFLSMLKRGGIDVSTMYQQIESQVAWSKLVQKRLRSRVIISERDIDDTLERVKSKIGTTEYLVAEIFLPVENTKKGSGVKKLALELVREIKVGKVSFFKLAQQFSQAAGSAKGGDKGWVNEAQFPEELLSAVSQLNKKQVTAPIKTSTGYHIFLLRDKRILSDETLPSRDQIEYNIGTERLDRLQRQHLLDLRLASFIDVRI